MKFWQKLLAAALGIIIISLAQFIYKRVSTPSHFVITPGTKIDPNSDLARFVTQEEVDELSFKHWDIYDEQKIRYQEPNATLKILRDHLEAKDTNGVLKFLKDNNLSADVKLWANTTPLMYASFHNDETTAKELIKLGANPHQTDKYKLSALAYAIENNSTKTAKLLLDSGVKFKELGKVQIYRSTPLYSDIEKLIVDDDNITIIYSFSGAKKFYYGYTDEKTGKTSRYTYMYDELPFRYIVENNFTEITRLVLESGYRPDCTDRNREDDEACYRMVDNVPNYEPMLDLLLEYDLPGQPSKEMLKKGYDECYSYLDDSIRSKERYVYEATKGIDHKAEDEARKNKPRPLNPIIIKSYDYWINARKEHCLDKNGTFADTKAFLKWKNWENKMSETYYFKIAYPDKVYLKDKNMTLEEDLILKLKTSNNEDMKEWAKQRLLESVNKNKYGDLIK
ncbi:ankyrin repeat domain-containing protein [Campylobacter showae]|uniref:ankyrin repeat domain-containing protein n=1 Tax=Campylobacter showae TaxID=204 RepID=UPI003C6F8609